MSILQMSISAGLLVIVIVLIRAVALNRLPKKMFLVLWGVVLLRLLIPVSIPLPFNFPNVFVKINEVLRTPLLDNPVNIGEMATGIIRTEEDIAEAVIERVFNTTSTTAIYLVGMFMLFIFFSVIYFRNHREMRYATSIHDNNFLNEWLAENRLTRHITIMQSDRIISPLAVGILKPRIILPKSMNMNDKQLLNYVLTHEYYHVKRFDALWKTILLLVVCVHWFNPMAWLMFILASRDLELTCDEAVIYRFGTNTKKAYAYMLIGLAEQQGIFAPLYNGFSRNATEERIKSIMKFKKKSILAITLSVALIACTAITVFAVSTNAEVGTPLAVLAEKLGISTVNKTEDQIKTEIAETMDVNDDIVTGEPDADAITLENAIVSVKSVLAEKYGVSQSLLEQYCYYETYNVFDTNVPQWIIDVNAEGNPEIWDANDGRFIVTLNAKSGDVLDVKHIVYPSLSE